jgi:hypothetical protein
MNEFQLSQKHVKRLNLISDNELYEMAENFVRENGWTVSKTKMNKLKGLIHTITGVRGAKEESRAGIIIKYLRHQIQKSTIKEDEKIFYNNLIQVINADDGLRKFLNLVEFSDCQTVDSDSRAEKKNKKDRQDYYMYYIAKEFINHVLAEKMKGN